MISHSPPIFSHSPPVSSYFTDFMSNHRQNLNYNDDVQGNNGLNSSNVNNNSTNSININIGGNNTANANNRTSRYCRPQMFTLASKAMVNNAQRLGSPSPVRSVSHAAVGMRCNSVAYNTMTNGHNSVSGGGGGGGSGPTIGFGLGRVVSSPNFALQPKSCLSRKKSCIHKNENTEESSDSRPRKHVIFADDEGLSLTEVRVMSEPSNVPPYWSIKFLEQITQGLVSPQPADQWTVDFKQPASDYLSFRQKIDNNFVSLENVIVKDEESIVVGTVKVKNISFEKEVVVRVTWDDWKSQQDIFCTFARAYGATTCAHVVFDTFSFKITLPPSSKRLEFCICFRANTQEYWDNNDGKNYTITKRSPFYYNALSPYDKNSTRNSCQSQLMSTLSEALAKENETSGWQEPSPYW